MMKLKCFEKWLCVKVCILFLQILPVLSTFGQVANNNIKDRSTLMVDDIPTFSHTNHASVEWECVNKALTHKCLVYHNDQWFQFRVSTPGLYYLNIGSQKCRDEQGVQLIVIEGNPCEIQGYKILKCIPKIRQQDIFVELDSLKSNIDYLINMDGFLGDFCSFDIQLSTKPKGIASFPVSGDKIELSADLTKHIVALEWTIDESMASELTGFEIHRNHQAMSQFKLIGKVPLETNTVGVARPTYSFTDTLHVEGNYTYEVHGNFKGGLVQILTHRSLQYLKKRNLGRAYVLHVSLDFRNRTPLQMLLLDRFQDQVLKQTTFEFDKKTDTNQQIDVAQYVTSGIHNFVVRIINLNNGERKDYAFEIVVDKN